MFDPDNIIVLMMTIPEYVTTIKMTITKKDKQILKLVVKDAQNG